MMRKNVRYNIRTDSQIEKKINEIIENMGLSKSQFLRYCLTNTIKDIYSEKIKAGGWEKLKFGIKTSN